MNKLYKNSDAFIKINLILELKLLSRIKPKRRLLGIKNKK